MPSFEKNSPAAVGLLSDDQIATVVNAVVAGLAPQLQAIQDGINALAESVAPAPEEKPADPPEQA